MNQFKLYPKMKNGLKSERKNCTKILMKNERKAKWQPNL